MSDVNSLFSETSNILDFPSRQLGVFASGFQVEPATPIFDQMVVKAQKLDEISNYESKFDYSIYKNLEIRFKDRPIRGGITMGKTFRLVNAHSTCQQCLYSFEIDTYGRGCIHDCVYCYAKAELTVHGYWNNPVPAPIDINDIRQTFYTVFETEKPNKWREVLEKRIPLRIGSMSDSFMWMDQKYKVSQELLRILNYYKYPYIIFTRSDLVATDEYIKLLDKNLCSVQFSISSTDQDLLRKVEPGAPSAKRRLEANKKLNDAGFWTTIRINPLFPNYPDGFYSGAVDVEKTFEPFNFSSTEMIQEFASYGVKSVLVGFVRLSRFSLARFSEAVGRDLKPFFNKQLADKSARDFHYSDLEIRAYYEQYKKACFKNNMEFSTCYIGNGEQQFWRDQDIWSNKKDCCNVKDRVVTFNTDARSIPIEKRLYLGGFKTVGPNPHSESLHKEL